MGERIGSAKQEISGFQQSAAMNNQGWGTYNLSGQPVPVFYHPHRHTVDSYSTCHQPKPPDLFPQGCPPASHPPICMYNQDYPVPGVESGTCLLNFIWLVIAQLSSLSRSLCKASLPLREDTAPPSLVSSANLLN
ncbi:hypothetical protein QYF61_022778, partial [Mycteria americana]